MWLPENGKAPDHTALSPFRTGRCAESSWGAVCLTPVIWRDCAKMTFFVKKLKIEEKAGNIRDGRRERC